MDRAMKNELAACSPSINLGCIGDDTLLSPESMKIPHIATTGFQITHSLPLSTGPYEEVLLTRSAE